MLPGQKGGSWAKVQRGAVAGTWPQESVPLGQGGDACPGGQELQGDQPGLLRRLSQALGGWTREGPEAEQRAWWGREDQRATGVPAGFPRWTAGQVWPRGQRAAGGWGEPGVWPGRPQERQPINLRLPREVLRGFAFCLANYSASPLFLSWGAQALPRALIKRKPLSQLPQGWGNR